MPNYYYILLLVLIVICILLIRYFLNKRKTVPNELFSRALRDENDGDYIAAVTSYENALLETRKKKFQDPDLETRILEKLKVLHTMIDYENGFHSRK
jgi:hypothetical protein